MATSNERFIWATEFIKVQAADQILEIGCGTGIWAELLAAKLSTGHLTAIDRSATMIQKAEKRNSRYVSQGLITCINTSFADAALPQHHFDKVVAFNVSLFWKKPSEELKILRDILSPSGKLYLFHQAPYDLTKDAAKPILENLKGIGFHTSDIQLKNTSATNVLVVVAKPS